MVIFWWIRFKDKESFLNGIFRIIYYAIFDTFKKLNESANQKHVFATTHAPAICPLYMLKLPSVVDFFFLISYRVNKQRSQLSQIYIQTK